MKLSLSLLALVVVVSSLPACTTLANRRTLYRPVEASGPYSKQYSSARANEGLYGISQNDLYPVGPNEGIFGVSNSDARYSSLRGEEEGIFGISRNVR